MDENILTLNVPNMITVLFMGATGLLVISLILGLINRGKVAKEEG